MTNRVSPNSSPSSAGPPRPAVLRLLVSLVVAGWLGSASAAPTSDVSALLEQHCASCHSGDAPEGGLNASAVEWPPSAESLPKWVRMHDRLAAGEMPPADAAQPSDLDHRALQDALATAIVAAERAAGPRTGLRRLNRVEYENTVRELLHVPTPLREMLPQDPAVHGYDTVAEGLRFSPLLVETYLQAADVALADAIVLFETPAPVQRRMTLKDEAAIRENLDTPDGVVKDPVSQEKHRVLFRELPDAVVMFSDGYPPGDFKQFGAPVSGTYRIRASAYGYASDGAPVTLRLYVHRYREKRLLGAFEMPAGAPREVECIAHLNRDELIQVLPYGVGNDRAGQNIWSVGADNFDGAGLALQWVEVEGPLGDWPPRSVRSLFDGVPLREIEQGRRPWRHGGHIGWELAPEDPRAAARRVIEHFAARAFRRPLHPGEAEPYLALALAAMTPERPFESAVAVGLRGVLAAPQFLLVGATDGAWDDFALATRLSYFLTTHPPDDELLRLAADGRLSNSTALREQTERLLNSPQSREFVRNFTGQWLDLRRIRATSPDRQLYPEYDELLESAMVAEAENYFAELLAHDLSLSHLIHSDFVLANRRLARHYGLPGVEGEEFVRVSLPSGSPRGGLLGLAVIHKVTANGTVTSPVLRGAWVMKRLLGKPPQPPPPNVGSVEPDTRGATTIREQLDKHRNSETCVGCHQNIDPPGFALECFDVIGGWRDRYRSLGQGDPAPWTLDGRNIWEYRLGPAVDASGRLPDGRTFRDIAEFKQLLLSDQRPVVRCLADHLMTYATGAPVRFADRAELDRLVDDVARSGGGLRALVHAVVQSPLFQEP